MSVLELPKSCAKLSQVVSSCSLVLPKLMCYRIKDGNSRALRLNVAILVGALV